MRTRKPKLPALPTLTEKQEEHFADRAARMMGYDVVRFSQPRATKQTPGIPDRLYLHPVHRVAVWAELKSEKGKATPAQKQMHERLRASGQNIVCGTANSVGMFLAATLTRRQSDD